MFVVGNVGDGTIIFAIRAVALSFMVVVGACMYKKAYRKKIENIVVGLGASRTNYVDVLKGMIFLAV